MRILFFTGKPYTVTSVTVINRSDCCADRERNLRVGVTDVQPIVGVDIDPNSYTVCGDKDGKYRALQKTPELC